MLDRSYIVALSPSLWLQTNSLTLESPPEEIRPLSNCVWCIMWCWCSALFIQHSLQLPSGNSFQDAPWTSRQDPPPLRVPSGRQWEVSSRAWGYVGSHMEGGLHFRKRQIYPSSRGLGSVSLGSKFPWRIKAFGHVKFSSSWNLFGSGLHKSKSSHAWLRMMG